MHEYKVVPAPVRPGKVKGLRSPADRFAHALGEVLNAWAAQGWEYLRTETFTIEERRGLLGRVVTTTQTVLILRRERAERAATTLPARERAAPPLPGRSPASPAPVGAAAEPPAEARPEPVFRPGAMLRAEGPRKYPPLRKAEAPAAPDGAS